MHKRVARISLVLIAAVAVVAGQGCSAMLRTAFFSPSAPQRSQLGLSLSRLPESALASVATHLEVPWEIAFLPDGDLLVTERSGRLVRVSADGHRRAAFNVPGVRQSGEGGLLGMAVHPRFNETAWIYLYLSADGESGVENRVERYRLTRRELTERRVILEGIPAAIFHDGGRIAFGPDARLYITTGDGLDSAAAQDKASLAGKILRMTETGGVPEDNPFGNPVFSYGHRNSQGLTWDESGRLWAGEHGRSGLLSGLDELNRVEKGKNYGWPVIEGDAAAPGMQSPVLHSGADVTWAPAGMAFVGGGLFFGGLRGEALYEVRPAQEGGYSLLAHFYGDFGRIRAVSAGPDGMLYFGTSNRDGRGRAREGDDRIFRLDPAVFRQDFGRNAETR